jgi:site-specific DNA-methyltransferase (adenine-specific)
MNMGLWVAYPRQRGAVISLIPFRMNKLLYGDNLTVLKNDIRDESADLIYIDPPFNSQASYNVLFKSPSGEKSHAQIEAFEDTWHWEGGEAESAFDEVMHSGNSDAAEILRSLRSFLKENDMMAYLCMMAVRLLELHRVLKPTGSIYLHCDPTASHYLKLLMDAVFGSVKFRNELFGEEHREGKASCNTVAFTMLSSSIPRAMSRFGTLRPRHRTKTPCGVTI